MVLSGNDVAAQGAPAELAEHERAFLLRVHGEVAAFTHLAKERGAVVERADGARVTLHIGELTTTDLFAIAREASAVIIELCPLSQGFKSSTPPARDRHDATTPREKRTRERRDLRRVTSLRGVVAFLFSRAVLVTVGAHG